MLVSLSLGSGRVDEFVLKIFENAVFHLHALHSWKERKVQLFGEDDRNHVIDAYTRTLKEDSPRYELYFKDSGILCEFKNIPLKGEKGNVVGFAGIARNITESRLLEQKNLVISFT